MLKRVLVLGTALSALMSAQAYAQETGDSEQAAENATDAPDGAAENVILVTGVRASLASAISQKRNAVGVVDAIAAEDIGKFPDLNISEALQRVTGVTITRSGNGEGRRISVRGAPPEFTQVTLNGITAASGNPGRDFDFDIFASELFQNVKLAKTPTADLIEGGLAANVDLRTPRPFDFSERQFLISAKAQYAELGVGEIDPRVSALYSDRLGDGRLGVLASVAYSESLARGDIAQGFSFQTLRQAGFNPATSTGVTVNGTLVTDTDALTDLANDVLIPTLPRTGPQIIDRRRLGITGALQFEASDALTLGVDLLYAKSRESTIRPTIDGLPGFGSAGSPVSLTVLDGFYAVAGTFDNVPQRSETADESFDTEFWHTTFDAELALSDTLTLTGQLGYSTADQEELRRTYLYSTSGRFVYDMSNPLYPEFGSPDFSHLDASAFSPNQLRFRPATRADDQYTARADLSWSPTGGSLTALQLGVMFRDQTKSQTRGEARSGFTAPFSDYATTLPFDNLLRDAPEGTPTSYLITDVVRAGRDLLPTSTTIAQDFPGSFEVNEKAYAGYAKTNWEFDLGSVPMTADVGVRVVKTDQTSNGYQLANGIPEAVSVSQSYTDVLPSANLKFDLSDDLVFRLAANKAIARPTLTDLSPGATVLPTQLRATIGNPNLDPFRATQFDASLEWYFSSEGLISAAAFYKDIESFIARVTEREVITGTNLINDAGDNVSGSTFDVTRPTNGAGGKLYGAEFSFQQPFTFLPAPFDGLGILANLTIARSEGTIKIGGNDRKEALPGQSDLSYNLVGYYEKDGFSFRAAYSYRSDFIESFDGVLTDGTLMVRRTDDRNQLDLSASYDFNDNFGLTFEALNILGEGEYSYVIDQRLNRLYQDQGPVYLVGFRAKL